MSTGISLDRKTSISASVSLTRKVINNDTQIQSFFSFIIDSMELLIQNLIDNSFNINDYENDKLLELSNRLESLNSNFIQQLGINIEFYNNVLSLTKKTVNYYLDIKNLEILLIDCDENKKILNDINLLYEQIQKLKQSYKIIPDQKATLSLQPVIKPQYIEYITRYGYPPDGVFDFNKL